MRSSAMWLFSRLRATSPRQLSLKRFMTLVRKLIGGEGLNYAGKTRIAGAQQLAKFLIKRLNAGEMPDRALANAKMNLRFTPAALLRRPEVIDALDFEILRRQ